MKYKDFYEGYPYGGFPVDKSDFKSVTPSKPEEEDEEGDEITVRGPRVSDFVEESSVEEEFKAKDMPAGSSWKLPGNSGWAAKNKTDKTNQWHGKDADSNKKNADTWRVSETKKTISKARLRKLVREIIEEILNETPRT